MTSSRLIRLPKPQRFLFCIPLRSAVELIVFITLINKVSGLYGILALFTGYELNFTQFSYYLYNLFTLVLVGWLASSIRRPEAALKTVALAWLYVLDTAINTVYTFFFIASWLSVLAGHIGVITPPVAVPGSGTIEDTAGFTSPEIEASHVDVSTQPSEGLLPGQDATAVASQSGSGEQTLLQSGGLMSLLIIAVFLLIRLYFCLIVLSYARNMLRHYIAMIPSGGEAQQAGDERLLADPFRQTREEGRGWQGRLGRVLMRFPSKQYWLGMGQASHIGMERNALKVNAPGSELSRTTKKLEQ